MAGVEVVSRGDLIALAVLTAIAVAAVIYAVIGSSLMSRRPPEAEQFEER
ncbi:hypothetical protein [Phaeacidiphilus oryzae]|nr:hypothetical protein [Phaeacidiphilus oryzae]